MTQYRVINTFKENKHEGHIYKAGDVYPAQGKKLVKARAEFLTKKHAKYGVAFLEAVEVPTKKPEERTGEAEKSDA